jgi:serine/threonine protein kinase
MHRHNVAHLDLKSDNTIVTKRRQRLIIDFSVANSDRPWSARRMLLHFAHRQYPDTKCPLESLVNALLNRGPAQRPLLGETPLYCEEGQALVLKRKRDVDALENERVRRTRVQTARSRWPFEQASCPSLAPAKATVVPKWPLDRQNCFPPTPTPRHVRLVASPAHSRKKSARYASN